MMGMCLNIIIYRIYSLESKYADWYILEEIFEDGFSVNQTQLLKKTDPLPSSVPSP